MGNGGVDNTVFIGGDYWWVGFWCEWCDLRFRLRILYSVIGFFLMETEAIRCSARHSENALWMETELMLKRSAQQLYF